MTTPNPPSNDEKLPLGQAVRWMLGMSIGSWMAIIGSIWLICKILKG